MAAEKESHQGSNEKEGIISGVFSSESIKFAAEAVGFEKPSEEVQAFLAENVTYRVREILQDAIKFQHRSKRRKLNTTDVDNALRAKCVEPIYGFSYSDSIPFRYASGGGRELYFQEDVEVDLDELINQSLAKIPLEVSLKSHWLAVEGVQPAIPENPPPIGKDAQKKDTVEPLEKSLQISEVDVGDTKPDEKLKPKLDKDIRSSEKKKDEELRKAREAAKQSGPRFKPLVTHELSVEQQLYFKEITEACVGSNESKRTEAHQSLSSDPGLYQLLPRFTSFISEGVKVNVAQNNLALLIYLLRMIKALMENASLYLEKYLHELIPAVLTCVVSRRLCPRPDFDNHWALRDFAARLLAQICKSFSSPTNNIQSRITKILCKSFFNEKAPLVTHYGAVSGLSELGLEVVKFLVLPRLKVESELIRKALESNSPADKMEAEHLQVVLLKHCSVLVSKTRNPPDVPDQYVSEFGFLGTALCNRVATLRLSANAATPKTPSTPTTPGILR